MSLIFSKSRIAAHNSARVEEQYKYVQSVRRQAEVNENRFLADGLVTNSGRIPADVWRGMDQVAIDVFRQPNLTFMEDMMALADSVSIGKIVMEYRKASDAGNVVVSLSGQTPLVTDKTEYDYGGTVIPMISTGFNREWREMEGMRSEGFDGLIDDARNSTRNLLSGVADLFYNGRENVRFKGYTAFGVKNNPATALIDLGAGGLNIDLTSAAITGEQAFNAFKSMRDRLRINNAVLGSITFYVSRTILSNLERPWAANNSSNVSILDWIRKLEGVAAVKEDASLTGNELILGVVDRNYIKPKVGLAVATFQRPRTAFNDNYDFMTACAVGLEIRSDYTGKSAWAYARVA